MPNGARLGFVRILSAIAAVALAWAPSSGRAEPFGDMLERWAVKLDARAAEVDASAVDPVARVGVGGPLRPGKASGERVWRLSHRLMELGYLQEADLSSDYNERTEEAVKAFQASVGLKPDGVVGTGTVAALDQSPRVGAASMRDSAAQMRALKAENIQDMLYVNLPSQTVTLVRGGQFVLTMRAIVGRPSRETPLLRDKITHIIVNPTWTVPPTVLKEDKLPNLRKSGKPGVSNAAIFLDGEEIDPAIIDWAEVSPGRVRIVQAPGNHNALGRFRFNLTNRDSIYLHGTNEPHLFDRDIRAISSGCVRLEDARRLAELLLAENGVGPEKVQRLMDTMTPQWVALQKPLPVRFTYWLATVGDDDRVRVHPDVYERSDESGGSAAVPHAVAAPSARRPG